MLRRGLAAVVFMAALAAAPGWAMQKITVGQVGTADLAFAPLALAEEMGLVAAEGLSVEILPVRSSAALLTEVAAGRALLGYCRPDALAARGRCASSIQSCPPVALAARRRRRRPDR